MIISKLTAKNLRSFVSTFDTHRLPCEPRRNVYMTWLIHAIILHSYVAHNKVAATSAIWVLLTVITAVGCALYCDTLMQYPMLILSKWYFLCMHGSPVMLKSHISAFMWKHLGIFIICFLPYLYTIHHFNVIEPVLRTNKN